MILSQCQYKNNLSLQERLDIASEYVFLRGRHGSVSELAKDHSTNRQQIYSILDDVKEGFYPKLPGPKAESESSLRQEISLLQAREEHLEQENEQLRHRLQRSVEVTPKRLERFILTSISEIIPYETIQAQVEAAYGDEYVPSVGALSGMVNHIGTVAGLILSDQRVVEAFEVAGCDEIFFHQQPILTVVEPDSMAIGAIEKSADRTGESWLRVLSYFPKLKFVVSDLARGLSKGKKLRGDLLHQGDLYHFLRQVGWTTQGLERLFEQMLKQEEQAWDDYSKGKIYTPTLEKTLFKVETFLCNVNRLVINVV